MKGKERKSKWDGMTAAACITRKGGLVDISSKRLWCPPTVGIRVLGAIDFLCNYLGFVRLLSNESLTKSLKKGYKHKSGSSEVKVVKIFKKNQNKLKEI